MRLSGKFLFISGLMLMTMIISAGCESKINRDVKNDTIEYVGINRVKKSTDELFKKLNTKLEKENNINSGGIND